MALFQEIMMKKEDCEEEPIKIIWKEYFDPFLVIKVQPDMSFYLALC